MKKIKDKQTKDLVSEINLRIWKKKTFKLNAISNEDEMEDNVQNMLSDSARASKNSLTPKTLKLDLKKVSDYSGLISHRRIYSQ